MNNTLKEDSFPEEFLDPDYSDHVNTWSRHTDNEITVGWNRHVANVDRDKDARLISRAPEMYRLLLEIVMDEDICATTEERIKEILSYVDGEEGSNE